MSDIEKLGVLQKQEQEEYEKYLTSKESELLNNVINLINRREYLLNKRFKEMSLKLIGAE